jgi:hypothetical protein
MHTVAWLFIEKAPIVSLEPLDARSAYPRVGVIAGEVVGRMRDAAGRELIRFATAQPWDMETVDAVSEFDLLPSRLIEL